MNSHIENLLLESLPGNNLTPRDLKSTDRFTAEENRIQKRAGKSENRFNKVEKIDLANQFYSNAKFSSLTTLGERKQQSIKANY